MKTWEARAAAHDRSSESCARDRSTVCSTTPARDPSWTPAAARGPWRRGRKHAAAPSLRATRKQA